MTIAKASTMGAALNQTRERAKRTVNELISWHHSRIAEINEGHRYYRRGDDITDAMRKRHEYEIGMCRTVLEAMDCMSAGDIERAAGLCSQIKEHLPNVN